MNADNNLSLQSLTPVHVLAVGMQCLMHLRRCLFVICILQLVIIGAAVLQLEALLQSACST